MKACASRTTTGLGRPRIWPLRCRSYGSLAALFLFFSNVFSLGKGHHDGTTPEAVDIGSRLELFVDEYLVDSMSGVSLQLHRPQLSEPVLKFDADWEGPGNHYITVFKDEDIYRLYYRCVGGGDVPASGEGWLMNTCYAESRDGINWIRPKLGLVEYNGSKENNIILTGEEGDWGNPVCNFYAFRDTNPAALASERYKGVGGINRGLYALVSADGVHWKPKAEKPMILHSITHKPMINGFDSPQRHLLGPPPETVRCLHPGHVSGSRWRKGPQRPSVDFDRLRQLVLSRVDRYGRRPSQSALHLLCHTLLQGTPPLPGLSQALHAFSTLGTAERLRSAPWKRAVRLGVHGEQRRPALETLSGGLRSTRSGSSQLDRPQHYVARGLVAAGPNEIAVYVLRHFRLPSLHLRRGILRTDGFVSVNAPYQGGEILTKPLLFKGSRLIVNYSTSAAGGLRVEILDTRENPSVAIAWPTRWSSTATRSIKLSPGTRAQR